MKKLKLWGLALVFLGLNLFSFGQGTPDYQGGLKVNFTEDGSRYFRVIAWGQMWGQYKETAGDESPYSLSIRRARVLMYTQMNKRFLLLTHFGLNSLNASNMHPVGKGDGSQLFLHGMWAQYTVIPDILYAGAGLHYWNGLTRLTSQSTLNMLTLDNYRTAWATLGLSDQFARHLGIFLQGHVGNLQYRLAVNDAIEKTLDANLDPAQNCITYRGKELLGKKAQFAYQGYLEYQFLDKESHLLPYKVGTYLGSKKVLNLGAGFFHHPNGTVCQEGTDLHLAGHDVNLLAIDLYFDYPIGDQRNDAITAYATYMHLDYGPNYLLNQTSADIGTGEVAYGHVGYLIPEFTNLGRLQPYLSYSYKNFDAADDSFRTLGIGANWFMTGHHAKFTIEYKNESFRPSDSDDVITVQAMIYL